jgi:hypothetical protein
MQNFMKIRPVRAELFHAGGRTDRQMTKIMAAFRNFENAHTNAMLKIRQLLKPRHAVHLFISF